jgi:hypothetical protein
MDHKGKIMRKQRRPLGLITLGHIDPIKLEEFKTAWQHQMSGAMNAFKTPIVNSSEVRFIPFKSPKRARFSLYIKTKPNANELLNHHR